MFDLQLGWAGDLIVYYMIGLSFILCLYFLFKLIYKVFFSGEYNIILLKYRSYYLRGRRSITRNLFGGVYGR